ncbi:hypothetical protein AB1Y20_001496 [Prymnesium parvum]|uniref:F-box domain-containing protein n=1 Tax=Prymnesium parvum TaxID=97485 RepID=A0AB34KCQ2_PRYPA
MAVSWKVVHRHVCERAEPSTHAHIVGHHELGALVVASSDPVDGWLPTPRPGWILLAVDSRRVGAPLSRCSPALLCELPPDVALQVLTQLRLSELGHLRSASRQLRALCSSAALWQSLAAAERSASFAGIYCGGALRCPPSLADVVARLVPWPHSSHMHHSEHGQRAEPRRPAAEAEAEARGGEAEAREGEAEEEGRTVSCDGEGACAWVLAKTAYPVMRSIHATVGADDFVAAAAGGQSWRQPWLPLPFATGGAAMGAAWAVRLSAYFELRVVRAAPAAELTIGLCGLEALPSAPLRSAAAIDRRRLHEPAYEPQARWCALSAGARLTLRRWDEGDRRLKEELLQGPPLRAGEVFGCGIDYARGVAFFTRGGARLDGADVGLRLDRPWRALVGLERGGAEVRLSLRGPFAFALARLEASLWHSLASESGTKVLVEAHCIGAGAPDSRGWPKWEDVAERCVRPWLLAAPPGRRRRGAANAAAASAAPAGLPTDPRDAPAPLRLWPTPDPLALTPADEAAVGQLLSRAGLPASLGGALTRAGLCVGRLAALPLGEAMAVVARETELSLGQRVRLKHQLQCEFGVREAAEGRTLYFGAPLLVVVRLAPGLPVRAGPALRATPLGKRRKGEVLAVTAVHSPREAAAAGWGGECDGWLRLHPGEQVKVEGEGQKANAIGWVLCDGRVAAQRGRMVVGLRSADEATLSARGASFCRSADADCKGSAEASGRLEPVEAAAEPSVEEEQEDELGSAATPSKSERRELQMLLQIADLPNACVEAFIGGRVGVERLRHSSLDEVEAIACGLGLRPAACLRLLLAVRLNLHRRPVHLDAVVVRLVKSRQDRATSLEGALGPAPMPRLGLARAVRGGRVYG